MHRFKRSLNSETKNNNTTRGGTTYAPDCTTGLPRSQPYDSQYHHKLLISASAIALRQPARYGWAGGIVSQWPPAPEIKWWLALCRPSWSSAEVAA
ncbi:hypothetical protein Pcinc_033809 [Petrolisthes cinctipes]|uniref:Uncharacterized protein n=1 Tax=Petrolisthes cinctipes TaxID=88211 RepID=A0AAE1BMZ1_PETCI|nr:hypothetical protein Pcinc_041559 [Petrolisthes cinctipes]KAK3860117.1 hypothetical protein Pcinc_033809 [Petrolisthes cinctipes]